MDISVHSDYLPFSSDLICDEERHDRSDNSIKVVTGNRPHYVGWYDDSNLPGGWIDNTCWGTNTNLQNGWNDSTNIESWSDSRTLPGGWKNTKSSENLCNDTSIPDGWKRIHYTKGSSNKRKNNTTVKKKQ